MAKKKHQGKRRTRVDDSGDESDSTGTILSDSVSTSSFGTNVTDDSDFTRTTWEDDFLSAIDDLTEKASAKRARGLEVIKKQMARRYVGELLDQYRDTLHSTLMSLLHRGSMTEQTQCAQILVLYALTVHDLEEDNVSQTCDMLRTKIAEGSAKSNVTSASLRATERRVECVRALCMWKFVTTNWDELARNGGVMDTICDPLWNDRDPAVLAEAVHGWTLMAASLSSSTLEDMILPRYRDRLAKMLQSGSADVRFAAGEALALLFEAHHFVQDALPPAQRELDPALDDIIESMEELTDESGKHMSRKSRTTQKGHFRSYVSTLEGDGHPKEQVTIHKNKVIFEGWPAVILFQHMKHALGSGIADHFQSNHLVRAMLHLEEENFDPTRALHKLSNVEKRQYLSKSSFAAKQETITKSKLTRSSTNFSVIGDDDDDGGW